jgi:hypothetical protein
LFFSQQKGPVEKEASVRRARRHFFVNFFEFHASSSTTNFLHHSTQKKCADTSPSRGFSKRRVRKCETTAPWRRGKVVIASAYRKEDPGFKSPQGVRFLGIAVLLSLLNMHCHCMYLRKMNAKKCRHKKYTCF